MSKLIAEVITGDCLDVLREFPDDTFASLVTDPPYGLKFMGKAWDHGVPGVEFWREFLRVAKPGAHLLAFGGTRTFHRLMVAIEDAGWELRDTIMWTYGSATPHGANVSKLIDKAAGAEREVVGVSSITGARMSGFSVACDTRDPHLRRAVKVNMQTIGATEAAKQWEDWHTGLKPAWEPIVVARKPLVGTVAENVLRYGTGALNIGACRVGPRFPANLIHDGSDDVVALFPDGKGVGHSPKTRGRGGLSTSGHSGQADLPEQHFRDAGSVARFFYCAKASTTERNAGCDGNKHPTVKPQALMRYLCRLVTPPGGVILDPFVGSGSTGVAAIGEGFHFVGIDKDPEAARTAKQRVEHAKGLRT